MPILHHSHGVGSLAFAADGTLLVTIGDAASYEGIDAGSYGGTFYQAGIDRWNYQAGRKCRSFPCTDGKQHEW